MVRVRASSWTTEEDTKLAELRAQCLSPSEIAERLGRSRQAVNFRVHKLQLPRPATIYRGDIAARFWAKVEKLSDGCWLWKASCFRNGYGCFDVGGHSRKAHRFAYELLVGPIPEGFEVRHRCDVPRCVNPDHLELGSHTDNMRDMVVRGRVARGPQNGRYKHGERTRG